jgi:hypothetical protein
MTTPDDARPAAPVADPAPAGPAADSSPAAAGSPAADRTPLLPEQSREDTDAAWGEYPESADDRLYRDRPPHWAD